MFGFDCCLYVCVRGWWKWGISYLVGTFSGRELFEKDQ